VRLLVVGCWLSAVSRAGRIRAVLALSSSGETKALAKSWPIRAVLASRILWIRGALALL
jgi:hypothetical protein